VLSAFRRISSECGLHFETFTRLPGTRFSVSSGDDRQVIVFRQQYALRSTMPRASMRNERSEERGISSPWPRDPGNGPALGDGDVDAVGQHTLDDRALDLRHLLDGGAGVAEVHGENVAVLDDIAWSAPARGSRAVGARNDFVQIVVGISHTKRRNASFPPIHAPAQRAAKKTVLKTSRTPVEAGANARCSARSFTSSRCCCLRWRELEMRLLLRWLHGCRRARESSITRAQSSA